MLSKEDTLNSSNEITSQTKTIKEALELWGHFNQYAMVCAINLGLVFERCVIIEQGRKTVPGKQICGKSPRWNRIDLPLTSGRSDS